MRGVSSSRSALEPYYDYEDFPGDKVQSDDELLAAAKQRGTTTFHPMGTCRMGPENDPTSVVDDELRVRGLDGLRVVDASIMPMMLSANLNAGVMMIADKASDMIRGKAPPRRLSCAEAAVTLRCGSRCGEPRRARACGHPSRAALRPPQDDDQRYLH